MATKTCTQCQFDYEATRENFYACARNMDGLSGHCKNCQRKYYSCPSGRRRKNGIQNYLKPEHKQAYRRVYESSRYNSDPIFRLVKLCRNRVRLALKGYNKPERTFSLIGCTPDFLKAHLSKQFLEGMSWDNFGEWHIDHIKPCSLFDLTVLEQRQKCFHYSNLQPLWALDNLKKGDKVAWL